MNGAIWVLGEPPCREQEQQLAAFNQLLKKKRGNGMAIMKGRYRDWSSIAPEVKTRTKNGSFAEGQPNIKIRRHFVTKKTIKPNFLPFTYLYLLHLYATHLAIESDGLYPAF